MSSALDFFPALGFLDLVSALASALAAATAASILAAVAAATSSSFARKDSRCASPAMSSDFDASSVSCSLSGTTFPVSMPSSILAILAIFFFRFRVRLYSSNRAGSCSVAVEVGLEDEEDEEEDEELEELEELEVEEGGMV